MTETSCRRAQTGVEYVLIIAAVIFLAVLVFAAIRMGVFGPGASIVKNNSAIYNQYISCGYSSTCGCANQQCCSGDTCSPQYYCKTNLSPPPAKICVGR